MSKNTMPSSYKMHRQAHSTEGELSDKKPFLKRLGPGLITGASDDDPSGIATYSQAGAAFGYSMLWTMVLTFPLMGAIQEISARIGRVTGHGIAGNLRRHYPAWLLYIMVSLLLLANIINLGADIRAMGAALHLLIGGPELLYGVFFGLISLVLQVFLTYERYVAILKWFTLSLFAYVGTVFAIAVPWEKVLYSTVVPHITLNNDFIMTIVAVLGTTISPYLFFWQASQEVEEQHETPGEEPLKRAPSQAELQINRLELDTYVGMGFSNLIAYFIMLTTAVTLYTHGITDIESSAQAAEALKPIAGPFAFLLFSAGIIGTGMLAVPVLAGSAAYAVGEALKMPIGMARKLGEAKGFYIIIALAILIGVGLNFTPIDPIKALFWSAVINGVLAVPIMVMMMLIASKPSIMGRFMVPMRLKILGWIATIVMLLAAIALFMTMGH